MSLHFALPDNLENLEQYRLYASDLNMPIEHVDDLIGIVHAVLSYFVDQAFQVQTDQITLGSIGKGRSNAMPDHDTIEAHPEHQTAHVQCNGAEEDSKPEGSSEP